MLSINCLPPIAHRANDPSSLHPQGSPARTDFTQFLGCTATSAALNQQNNNHEKTYSYFKDLGDDMEKALVHLNYTLNMVSYFLATNTNTKLKSLLPPAWQP